MKHLFEVAVGQVLGDDERFARDGASSQKEHNVGVVDLAVGEKRGVSLTRAMVIAQKSKYCLASAIHRLSRQKNSI